MDEYTTEEKMVCTGPGTMDTGCRGSNTAMVDVPKENGLKTPVTVAGGGILVVGLFLHAVQDEKPPSGD